MGGSKKQTVGYRYSLGMHLALCHGPVDAIREILVDRRTAWSVTTGSGVSGGGAAVGTRIGTVAGMVATAALAGDPGATITFPGTLAGVRIGQEYRLRLANGASQTITLQGVSFDAEFTISSWTVLPVRISEIPDRDFTKSRTAVSVIPGQRGDGRSLRCVHWS